MSMMLHLTFRGETYRHKSEKKRRKKHFNKLEHYLTTSHTTNGSKFKKKLRPCWVHRSTQACLLNLVYFFETKNAQENFITKIKPRCYEGSYRV